MSACRFRFFDLDREDIGLLPSGEGSARSCRLFAFSNRKVFEKVTPMESPVPVGTPDTRAQHPDAKRTFGKEFQQTLQQ